MTTAVNLRTHCEGDVDDYNEIVHWHLALEEDRCYLGVSDAEVRRSAAHFIEIVFLE